MENLEHFQPATGGYHLTDKDVTGGNKKVSSEMHEKLDEFIESQGFGLLLRDGSGHMVLNAQAGDLKGLRGTGRIERVDIQGPEGKNAARIAYQVRGFVIAQVIVPLKRTFSEAEFKQAFESSLKEKKVVKMNTDAENTTPPHPNIESGGKKTRRR